MPKDLKLLNSIDGQLYGDFNDLVIENFDLKLVDGREKIQQQVCKFLLTLIGSVPLAVNYGTTISSLVNGRMNKMVIQDIVDQIKYGLKYIKELNDIEQEELNINSIQSVNVKIVNEREIQIDMGLLLTDGTYLQIQEKAMGAA